MQDSGVNPLIGIAFMIGAVVGALAVYRPAFLWLKQLVVDCRRQGIASRRTAVIAISILLTLVGCLWIAQGSFPTEEVEASVRVTVLILGCFMFLIGVVFLVAGIRARR